MLICHLWTFFGEVSVKVFGPFFSWLTYFLNLFIFRQRGREGEKHQCVVASGAPPTGDLACNPGMCPDWESNQGPLGSQAGTQATEPHQPGPFFLLFILILNTKVILPLKINTAETLTHI